MGEMSEHFKREMAMKAKEVLSREKVDDIEKDNVLKDTDKLEIRDDNFANKNHPDGAEERRESQGNEGNLSREATTKVN